MLLHPQEIPPVPEETRHVAQAAFPRGNASMRIRDELGAIDDDQHVDPLISGPWAAGGVALASRLDDRACNLPKACPIAQAADAVRSRIDWKMP